MLVLPGLDALRGEVGALVHDQASRPLEPVRREKAPREQRVDRPVEPERVSGDQPGDFLSKRVRVAQAPHDAAGEVRADPRMPTARLLGFGLAEIVEQGAEPHVETRIRSGRRPGRRRTGARRAAPAAGSSSTRSR